MNIWKCEEPRLISGVQFADERGFVNHFGNLDISGARRTYSIRNSETHPFRGWHGHRHEAKVFRCTQGRVIVRSVKIPPSGEPDRRQSIQEWVLSSSDSELLIVPGGYWNSIEAIAPESEVLVMSNRTIEESLLDDYRLPEKYFHAIRREV